MHLSETEWKVMSCLWRRSPASARDVLEVLHPSTGWAYTTVKTLLSRLEIKGAVSSRRRANTSLYEPSITMSQARRGALRALLDRAFDGAVAPLMHHLIDNEKLSRADREQLRGMLDALDAEEGRRGRARRQPR